MKKILFAFICFFLSISTVKAFSIDYIDMNITLDENGTATINETWKAYVSDGSEIYHPYYNIDNSDIEVLSASMDGEDYLIVDSWNESGNLSDKAYKAGIYPNEHDGYDVVVGKTTYGTHIYSFTYQIRDFISTTSDSDMLYWTLVPSDFNVTENVTIKITGPYEYPDTLDVWGYGMYGAPCYVKDGAIYMTSDGPKSSGNALILLAKYPLGTFNSSSKLDNDFNHYLEMAKDGATSYKEKKTPWWTVLLPIIGNIVIWGFVISVLNRSYQKNKINYNFGETGNKLPKTVNNFREIPCNKDVYRAFWVADSYNISKDRNNFLGTLLLKWIYDGNVSVQTNTSKRLFKDKKEDVIIFNKEPEANTHEKNLYRYMLEASGDGVLEKDEFKKWCKNHYSKILNFGDKILDYERDELVKDNKIRVLSVEKGLAFKYKVNEYLVDSSMMEEAIQMKGLKQFLNEFSQIDKKEPIEVKLWNEYLMYAQIFGIADKVMERFKDLYPEIMNQMQEYNFDYNTFIFINSVSSSGVSAASAARTAAQSYSSGGGGFSSGGGGGGSFGGGFGGGSGSR